MQRMPKYPFFGAIRERALPILSLPRISKIYPAQIIQHFPKIQVVVRDYPLIVSGMESQLIMLDLGQKVQTCSPLRLNKSKFVFAVKITLAVGTA